MTTGTAGIAGPPSLGFGETSPSGVASPRGELALVAADSD